MTPSRSEMLSDSEILFESPEGERNLTICSHESMMLEKISAASMTHTVGRHSANNVGSHLPRRTLSYKFEKIVLCNKAKISTFV